MEFVAGLVRGDLSRSGSRGQTGSRSQHAAQARRGNTARKRRQSCPALVEEGSLMLVLHGRQFRRADKGGHHAGDLATLLQHAIDIRRSDHRGPAVECRFACRQRRIDDQVLALIEFLVERGQQSRTCSEMIVDNRFGHRRPLRQPTERQCFGAFLTRNAPGDIEELSVSFFAQQALTARARIVRMIA